MFRPVSCQVRRWKSCGRSLHGEWRRRGDDMETRIHFIQVTYAAWPATLPPLTPHVLMNVAKHNMEMHLGYHEGSDEASAQAGHLEWKGDGRLLRPWWSRIRTGRTGIAPNDQEKHKLEKSALQGGPHLKFWLFQSCSTAVPQPNSSARMGRKWTFTRQIRTNGGEIEPQNHKARHISSSCSQPFKKNCRICAQSREIRRSEASQDQM